MTRCPMKYVAVLQQPKPCDTLLAVKNRDTVDEVRRCPKCRCQWTTDSKETG